MQNVLKDKWPQIQKVLQTGVLAWATLWVRSLPQPWWVYAILTLLGSLALIATWTPTNQPRWVKVVGIIGCLVVLAAVAVLAFLGRSAPAPQEAEMGFKRAAAQRQDHAPFTVFRVTVANYGSATTTMSVDATIEVDGKNDGVTNNFPTKRQLAPAEETEVTLTLPDLTREQDSSIWTGQHNLVIDVKIHYPTNKEVSAPVRCYEYRARLNPPLNELDAQIVGSCADTNVRVR